MHGSLTPLLSAQHRTPSHAPPAHAPGDIASPNLTNPSAFLTLCACTSRTACARPLHFPLPLQPHYTTAHPLTYHLRDLHGSSSPRFGTTPPPCDDSVEPPSLRPPSTGSRPSCTTRRSALRITLTAKSTYPLHTSSSPRTLSHSPGSDHRTHRVPAHAPPARIVVRVNAVTLVQRAEFAERHDLPIARIPSPAAFLAANFRLDGILTYSLRTPQQTQRASIVAVSPPTHPPHVQTAQILRIRVARSLFILQSTLTHPLHTRHAFVYGRRRTPPTTPKRTPFHVPPARILISRTSALRLSVETTTERTINRWASTFSATDFPFRRPSISAAHSSSVLLVFQTVQMRLPSLSVMELHAKSRFSAFPARLCHLRADLCHPHHWIPMEPPPYPPRARASRRKLSRRGSARPSRFPNPPAPLRTLAPLVPLARLSKCLHSVRGARARQCNFAASATPCPPPVVPVVPIAPLAPLHPTRPHRPPSPHLLESASIARKESCCQLRSASLESRAIGAIVPRNNNTLRAEQCSRRRIARRRRACRARRCLRRRCVRRSVRRGLCRWAWT